MTKKLKALANQLSLRMSGEVAWGKVGDTHLQITQTDQSESKDYALLVLFNKPLPQLVNQLVNHPSLQDYKLGEKNFEWVSDDAEGSKVQRLQCALSYSFKDKSDELIPKIIEQISALVPPADCDLAGICESADPATTSCASQHDKPRLINGLILLLCPSCVERLKHEAGVAQKQLDALRPNYLLGSLYGFVGAFLGAALWLGVIIMFQFDVFILAALAGAVCGFAYRFGAVKLDNLGKVLIFALTLLASFVVNLSHLAYLISSQGEDMAIGEVTTSYVQYLATKPGDALEAYLFPILGAVVTLFLFAKDHVSLEIEE